MVEIDKKNSKKKSILHDGKFVRLILIALAGLVLMVMGSASSSPRGKVRTEYAENSAKLEKYASSLKKEIGEICRKVGGVSDVSVAVSFECGFEYVYATDLKSDTGPSSGQTQIKYITVGSGSSEQTVYVTEKLPVIGGIGIVCRGGDRAETVKRLTSLLSAAYNIGANKIYVTGT